MDPAPVFSLTSAADFCSTFQDFLTEEDFEKAFGMDRESFSSMASWKKDKLKKGLGLF